MILTLLIFIPISTALFLLFFKPSDTLSNRLALLNALVILALTLYVAFHMQNIGYSFESYYEWIPSYGIAYHLGIDGFSLAIMFAFAVILPVLYSYMAPKTPRNLVMAMLFAQGGATGALFSLDLLLFYLFWETMLLPIFIMIGIYGKEQPVRVAMELTLYTIFGSLLMLLAILMLGFTYIEHYGHWSFDILDLSTLHQTHTMPTWVFFAFMMAFFIKVPLFGFHGWLKSAYQSAPTPTLIILSAIMAKLGVYAMFRFILELFPAQSLAFSPYIIALGIVGMLYFGITALMQKNFRPLLAYSSASHMSFIVVGLFMLNDLGMSGSLYLITAHALGTAGLFILLSLMTEQTQNFEIKAYSGIIHQTPWFGTLFVLLALSIVGIPSSSGFVAELLTILGGFKHHIILGFFTATTLLIAMTFMLWLLQRTVFGPVSAQSMKLKELSTKDKIALSFLVLLIYTMGIYPEPFLTLFTQPIEPALLTLKGGV